MSATIAGKPTSFTTMLDPSGGVIGMNDRNQFVHLGFPDDLADGNHNIGEHGVSAYVGGDHSGAAVRGKLKDFKRGDSDRAIIQGKFEFTAVDEYDREIEVKDGAFSVSATPAAKADASGVASATFDPELATNAGFVADHFSYSGTPDKPGSVWVRQDENVQGGLSSLGVLFTLVHDDPANPAVGNAFMTLHQSIVPATLLSPATVDFTPGRALEIRFEVEFSYVGRSHRSKGSLVLDL
nr:hypothetical protein [uncultured Pseudomonas sp.]